jgi:hypothetical protein
MKEFGLVHILWAGFVGMWWYSAFTFGFLQTILWTIILAGIGGICLIMKDGYY